MADIGSLVKVAYFESSRKLVSVALSQYHLTEAQRFLPLYLIIARCIKIDTSLTQSPPPRNAYHRVFIIYHIYFLQLTSKYSIFIEALAKHNHTKLSEGSKLNFSDRIFSYRISSSPIHRLDCIVYSL